MIASAHRIVGVEHIAQLARHARQLVEGHAALGPIDEHAKDHPPSLGAVLDVDELEARRRGDGLRQLPDAPGNRGQILRIDLLTKRKSGPEPTSSRSGTARKPTSYNMGVPDPQRSAPKSPSRTGGSAGTQPVDGL